MENLKENILRQMKEYYKKEYSQVKKKEALRASDVDIGVNIDILSTLLQKDKENISAVDRLYAIHSLEFLRNGGYSHGNSDLHGIGGELMETEKGKAIDCNYQINFEEDTEKYGMEYFSDEGSWDNNGTRFYALENPEDGTIEIYELSWYLDERENNSIEIARIHAKKFEREELMKIIEEKEKDMIEYYVDTYQTYKIGDTEALKEAIVGMTEESTEVNASELRNVGSMIDDATKKRESKENQK